MSIATDIASHYSDGACEATTVGNVVHSHGAVGIALADPIWRVLAMLGVCPGAACNATARALCDGVSRWIFADGSSISTAVGGTWEIGQ